VIRITSERKEDSHLSAVQAPWKEIRPSSGGITKKSRPPLEKREVTSIATVAESMFLYREKRRGERRAFYSKKKG